MKLFLLMLLTLTEVFAQSGAKVLLVKGSVNFKGQKISKDQILFGKGEFSLGEKSYLRLLLVKSKTVIGLGANTTTEMDFEQKGIGPELNLIKGTARWLTGTEKLPKSGIKTMNAIMGVRGTDFFVFYNSAFGETEVICFDGKIQMTNQDNLSDSKIIGKNQWGGVGGRFGKNLADLLTLSPEIVSGFKDQLPLED